MTVPILSICIFAPLLAALVLAFGGAVLDRWAKPVALTASCLSLGIATWVAISYATSGQTFSERAEWFPQVGIGYLLGIDGLSVYMFLLAAWITAVAVWMSPATIERPRLYYGLLLALATGMLGVFCALDLVLFYVFWEVVFVPIYFLMTIWGDAGSPRAALKFLIFMLIGSLVMLLGVVSIYFASTPHTFDLTVLATSSFSLEFQRLAFAAFFIAFAVKVPIFPFHVWLPDAYTLSPAPLTALMSASLAAMGAYGFWRIPMSVLPEGFKSFALFIAILAVFSVVYGDVCATVQRDLKRMTAYASISHMGLVMLGAVASNVLGIRGSILLTFAHGVAMAALFFVIDDLQRLTGSRNANQVRQLMSRAPILATAVWVTLLASYGMPGLATFPGELMILLGAFSPYPIPALIALAATVITAGYIFWVLSRITLGGVGEPQPPLAEDLSGRRLASFGIFGVALVVLGIAPVLVTGPIQSSVQALVERIGG